MLKESLKIDSKILDISSKSTSYRFGRNSAEVNISESIRCSEIFKSGSKFYVVLFDPFVDQVKVSEFCIPWKQNPEVQKFKFDLAGVGKLMHT